MRRLAEIEEHIDSMSKLQEIMGAMRSLAAMRMQEAQQALPGTRRYTAAMAAAVSDSLLLAERAGPAEAVLRRPRALVVCMAEHGFAGGFNERLLEAARKVLETGDRLYVLGSRGAAAAAERGLEPEWMHAMASRSSGVPEMVRRLAAALFGAIAAGEAGRVEVLFTRLQEHRAATVEHVRLLPIETSAFAAEPARFPPLYNLEPQELQERLIEEHVLAQLTDAATESIASENAARFAAMESAHESVSNKLDNLHQEARQTRQSEITTELLDLVAGAESQAPP